MNKIWLYNQTKLCSSEWNPAMPPPPVGTMMNVSIYLPELDEYEDVMYVIIDHSWEYHQYSNSVVMTITMKVS